MPEVGGYAGAVTAIFYVGSIAGKAYIAYRKRADEKETRIDQREGAFTDRVLKRLSDVEDLVKEQEEVIEGLRRRVADLEEENRKLRTRHL